MTPETVSAFISGLVRPIAVIILLSGTTWGFVEGRIDGAAYLTLAGAAVAFLFGDRASSNGHAAGVQAALMVPPGAHVDNPSPPTPPTGG